MFLLNSISFIIFLKTCSARKPVFFIPGLMATRLHGIVSRCSYWYCSDIKDDDVWINDVLIIPPLYNCILEYVGLHQNNETNEVTQKEGVSIGPVDFGGFGVISFVDEFEHDTHFASTYAPLANTLKERGFVERESLF